MRYLYLSLMLMICLGCKKDNAPNEFNGRYSGTFVAYAGSNEINAPTEITLEEGRFQVIKGYKFGSGTYIVRNSSEIEFKDENIWTTEFDWALLLNGNYKYNFKGSELILTKFINGGSCFLCKDLANNRYQYKLKRK